MLRVKSHKIHPPLLVSLAAIFWFLCRSQGYAGVKERFSAAAATQTDAMLRAKAARSRPASLDAGGAAGQTSSMGADTAVAAAAAAPGPPIQVQVGAGVVLGVRIRGDGPTLGSTICECRSRSFCLSVSQSAACCLRHGEYGSLPCSAAAA